MAPNTPIGRAVVVFAGALLGGVVAAATSTVLPEPFPFAVALAVAVPVMDVGLYPQHVPDDARDAVQVGAIATLGGLLVGCGLAAVAAALDWTGTLAVGLAAGGAFLGAEAAGTRAREAGESNT